MFLNVVSKCMGVFPGVLGVVPGVMGVFLMVWALWVFSGVLNIPVIFQSYQS